MSTLSRHAAATALAPALLFLATAAATAETIEARHAAVATEHRLASLAGAEILQKGGNAVDAAAAAALATGVVNPSSSGIGGGGFLVFWDAKRKRAHSLDFRETASRHASETMFVRSDGSVNAEASRTGALAVGVPGELRGIQAALKRWGTMRFADVAAPAIRIARDGFAVEAHLASMMVAGRERLAADPGLASVFLHADGSPFREGEILKRPGLAATLERLSTVGVDDFYQGEIAADIVRTIAQRKRKDGTAPGSGAGSAPGAGAGITASAAAGIAASAAAGIATSAAAGITTSAAALDAKDLAAYEPREREPLRIDYRQARIWSMPPPSSGGAMLAEALGILSAWDIGKLDRSGPSLPHLLGETEKAVFADRATFYGDPDFTSVPLARLLGAAHAAELRAKIDTGHAVPSARFAPPAEPARDAGTSHISVVDADGNAAALTTSVNTGFGAGLSVPGRDIVLNNTMDDFSAQPGKPNAFGLVGSKANAIAPGKRPLSSMTPAVITEGGRVRLVAGGSGGPLIITATLATVIGVIDFALTTEEAVGAPRVHHQWMPDLLLVENGIDAKVKRALEHAGHKLAPLPGRASVQAIEVRGHGEARTLQATSDPRKGGVPAGY